MIKYYVLECWNPHTRRYEKFGKWDNIHNAEKTFDKPYFKTQTRRMLKVEIEVLFKEKSND